MNNSVISLKKELKRRDHIRNEFIKESVNFSFFDAISPDQNQEIAKSLGIKLENFDLTPVEISCFLSHLVVWRQSLHQENSYIGVFEDDIILGDGASLFLNDESWIPKNIDVIKLEKFDEKIRVIRSSKVNTLDNRVLYKLYSGHIGAAGYIISIKKAEEILNKIKSETNLKPLDHYLFEDLVYSDNIYQLLPAICVQDFIKNKSYKILGSALEKDRRKRFQNLKVKNLSIFSKFQREFLRILNQVNKFYKGILHGKKVDFR